MKKAVYHGIRDLRVEDIAGPKPGPKEVKVKVKYCGICGSDRHEYLHGLFPISPFGHEVCGSIVEVGAGIDEFQVGDRVLAVSKGGYAEYMTAPMEVVLKLPDSIGWKRAALIEPLAGAAYAVKRGNVKPDNTVLITGSGPVGLMLLMAVKAIGVKTVYMTDISSYKQEMAKKIGATDSFNPLEHNIPQKMKELTGGRGVDVSIEAVGIEASLKNCLASTRHQGTVIVQGIFTEKVPIHMLGFVTKEITMIGTSFIDFTLALDWITAKGLKPEMIVTSIIPLNDIVSRGFESKDPHGDIKILVEP